MIILGIDPGSRRMGYGLIKHQAQPQLITAGLLKATKKNDAAVLVEMRDHLEALIKEHKPDLVAVEKLFFVKNITTGIAVGQARGVVLELIERKGIPFVEITPTEIKQGVTGNGRANKVAVEKMVRLILGAHTIKLIDDALDALAVALVAGQQSKLHN